MVLMRLVRRPFQSEALVAAVRRASLVIPPGDAPRRHVLLAPPGRGNIGDQALTEAFVESVDAPVLVVVRSPRDIDVPPALQGRMQLLALPALIYGSAIGMARDLRQLGRALAGSATFSVLGADVMDGAYVVRASVNRAMLAARVAELGIPTRIVGFSWNAAPHRHAVRALEHAAASGVELLLRDPRSAARARRDGLRVTESADVVFTARTIDDTTLSRVAPGWAEGPLALVNASGLVDGQLQAYGRAVAALRAAGHRVLIVPHVSRPGADDMPVCRTLAGLFANDAGVALVPRLLAPREIRGLAAKATVTVTGRMHLAVMSLMAATPAVTVSTQDKVEGLMDLFDLPELAVPPGPGFPDRLTHAIDRVLRERDRLVRTIRTHLADVVSLSRENVRGLASVAHPTDAEVVA